MMDGHAAYTPLWPLVSMCQLEELLGWSRKDLRRIASRAGRYYRSFDLVRHGKTRRIDQPTSLLKNIQTRICRRILHSVVFPSTMYGGIPGRSIMDNAVPHTRQPVVVSLDLRDCFPRTSFGAVFTAYRRVFGCSPEIASLLTTLTTYQGHLPQGAPTSTALANLTLLPVQDELGELCGGLDLHLSLYVDDITISGPRAREAIGPAIAILQRHGHGVRHRKVRLMPKHACQEVTGIVVNRRPGTARTYREKVRAEIIAFAKCSRHPERQRQAIDGKVAHVAAISPRQSRRLKELTRRVLPQGVSR